MSQTNNAPPGPLDSPYDNIPPPQDGKPTRNWVMVEPPRRNRASLVFELVIYTLVAVFLIGVGFLTAQIWQGAL
jgi:hypothetical protein